MEIFKYVGAKIRELRTTYNQGKGIPQDALAKELKVTANTISRWETATYHPSLGDLDNIAKFFKISVRDLFPQPEEDNQELQELVQTAQRLEPEDLKEIRDYAAFKMAQRMPSTPRNKPGRKPKT